MVEINKPLVDQPLAYYLETLEDNLADRGYDVRIKTIGDSARLFIGRPGR